MANLAELRIATHQEHVSRDAIHEHLLARDAVVAECEEYPAHISVDLGVVDTAECVEQVHYAFLKQDIDALTRQGEVDEGQSTEPLDADLELWIHAKVHYHIDNIVIDQFLEQGLVVSQQ